MHCLAKDVESKVKKNTVMDHMKYEKCQKQLTIVRSIGFDITIFKIPVVGHMRSGSNSSDKSLM